MTAVNPAAAAKEEMVTTRFGINSSIVMVNLFHCIFSNCGDRSKEPNWLAHEFLNQKL